MIGISLYVGDSAGPLVGSPVGALVGLSIGALVGTFAGEPVGPFVGGNAGIPVGAFVGDCDGEGVICDGSRVPNSMIVFLALSAMELDLPMQWVPKKVLLQVSDQYESKVHELASA